LRTLTHTLQWRAFRHGAKTYVDAFLKALPSNHYVHLKSPVRSISRGHKDSTLIWLVSSDGSVERFDHVVLATHAHQALELLGERATVLEREILGAFKTSRNVCVLHSDIAVSLLFFTGGFFLNSVY
jgi:predicted NAD/FAD-binding protein